VPEQKRGGRWQPSLDGFEFRVGHESGGKIVVERRYGESITGSRGKRWIELRRVVTGFAVQVLSICVLCLLIGRGEISELDSCLTGELRRLSVTPRAVIQGFEGSLHGVKITIHFWFFGLESTLISLRTWSTPAG
jgi:hypothetical protein